ncbi:unnamed protein product, partial [Didymodactylos carnosus]
MKVNLGIGIYRDENGNSDILPVIRRAQDMLSNELIQTKAYLNHTGLEAYCESGLTLVLGVDSVCRKEHRACSVQGMGGTGSLRIGVDFLFQTGFRIAYVSTNHETILKGAGFEIREYRYWNKKTFNIDFVGLLEDLEDAPAKSVILLHACAHNPTGCDPTKEQWQQIAEIIQRKHLFPFFDLAYQGFSSGD